MAYETTYSASLADQQDLIDKYLQMDNELSNESVYDVDEMDSYESEEDTVQDDYEMYKNFYEENQAKTSLNDSEEDLSFLDFVFSGDNKYRSFGQTQSQIPGATPGFSGYAGNVSDSLKDNISKLESGGNYKAQAPNSTAKGKYQFIWSIHNKDIAKVTGAKTSQEFLNNPEAQEKYFDYWDQTTLTPSAKANYSKFKQYYPNATEDDVKRATHFAGRGNLEKALKTGNFTQPLDANKTSISKYVYGNKKAYGGYGDDRRQSQSESTSIQRPYNTLAISPNYAGRQNLSGLSASPNIKKIESDEENKRQLALRKKQGYTTGTGKTEPVYPEMLAFPGTPAIRGIGKLGNIAIDAINPVGGLRNGAGSVVSKTAKNLEDLEYAKNFYSKYNYDIPKNLKELAESDELTDATIQKLANQHNTFVRGVSTNWNQVDDNIKEKLTKANIDYLNNPEEAARYMATHVPGDTGYGRAGLNRSVKTTGKDAIYTSNSRETAEGYTYGDGYIVDVKKPTDFSSANRRDWIDQNRPDYYEKQLPSLRDSMEDEAPMRNAIESNLRNNAKFYNDQNTVNRRKVYEKVLTAPENYLEEFSSGTQNHYRFNPTRLDAKYPEPVKKIYNKLFSSNNSNHFFSYNTKEEALNSVENIRQDLRRFDSVDIVKDPEKIKQYVEETIDKQFPKDFDKSMLKTDYQNTSKIDFEKVKSSDDLWEALYNSGIQDQSGTGEKLLKIASETSERGGDFQAIIKAQKEFLEPIVNNKYAHYIHLGTPGEKILEAGEVQRITPDIYKNKSRSHEGRNTPGYSAAAIGGLGILGAANQDKKQYGGKIKLKK